MKICCPGCGSNIVFNPKTQKLTCNHCKRISSINEVNIVHLEDEPRYTECRCSSCGSKLITEDNSLITKCVYCGSTQIIKSRYNSEFKPTKIIPFKNDMNKFRYGFEEFIKDKNLASKDFIHDYENITNVIGVYVPFVVYKLNSKCSIAGQMVSTYEESANKKSHSARYIESEFSYSGVMSFDTSLEYENNRMDTIGPFNYDSLVNFNPAYLCSFSAKIGDEKDLQARLFNELNKQSDATLHARSTVSSNKEVPSSYIYDKTGAQDNSKYEFNGGVKKLEIDIKNKINVLVPVWLIEKEYKGQKYHYMMNGQTGKVYGEVPVSRNKLSLYLLNVCAFPFFYLAYYFYKFNQDISIVFIALIVVIVGLIAADYFLYPKYIEKYKFISKNNLNIDLKERITEYKELSKTEYLNKHKDNLKNRLILVTNNNDINMKRETKRKYNID